MTQLTSMEKSIKNSFGVFMKRMGECRNRSAKCGAISDRSQNGK